MKYSTTYKKGSHLAWPPLNLALKSFVLSTLILIGFQPKIQAQDVQFTRPSWWFGAAGGANFNFYRGSTQELNPSLTVPTTFHNGFGTGLYVAPLLEYHRPNSHWGFMLQAGLDSRKAKFDQVITPCNCPADLKTDLSYVTVEPSLRLAPFKSDFYLYAGPRFAYNLTKSFTYELGTNPALHEQPANPDVTGDFSHVNQMQVSMQVGAGYDIQLSSQYHQTQYVLSPFVSFQPYFGQSPRTIETWNITTVRAGAALKLGRGHKIPAPPVEATPVIIVPPDPEVQFTVYSPGNIPVERRVREIFPVRNYVFFDLGSTEIPGRYILLKKNQVKDFREDQLEVSAPKNLNGRSDRQMVVYYNVLNILGDRMVKNPSAEVTLVGSSEQGRKDGRAMAESVKTYLVTVFGIEGSRITTQGQVKPDVPSQQPGGTKELVLLREGDRRVSIESNSPALLIEFQSGPDTPLKPVEIVGIQEAPVDSYVSFDVKGADKAFTTWNMEIVDEKGMVQKFGPYSEEKISLPGKTILGIRPAGDYKVRMIGQTKSGNTVIKETSVHMVLWTPTANEEGMRYSIIYEFNNSKAISIYEKYLTDIVTPKIPIGGTVIIHGHTDIIGDEAHNMELSLARANDVKGILEKSLSNAGRSDVKIEVYGFGEDQSVAPFENKYPEERFYNRTVIIDIIPKK